MASPRAEVLVHLDHIEANVALLAERAGPAATMAVVKADGYGHGAVPVARAALRGGASWLGTVSLAEALALRDAGIDAPILCWLDPVGTDYRPAVAEGIDVAVSSVEQLRAVSGARVHLKIDTGLTRGGCPPGLWPELVRAAAASDSEVYAVWSHLACADDPGHPSIDAQARRFAEAYEVALAAGLRPRRHLANSAATLTRPDLCFDMVRVGIAMYGLNPVPGGEKLAPAMTFRSSVVSVKDIAAGESVSYGHLWTAERDTRLALVPVGYADGVPRLLTGRMSVLVNDVLCPVRGRICMDQFVVECDARPGDEVVLFGPGTRGEPTATDWAEAIGTIDYEIVTGMNRPRVTRTYLGER
ncbi:MULTISPECIES: alanine racemase [Actinokineospora]|uniref:Alanine racemase n=1 Tax=Actinokineospora fastidiosa TaxID=1816 RepID=A0A918LAG1_9PSEU|nr:MULTISPECIES: alanine racemase [Actinokineospora]UVS82112.1 Alanine racemase [Actinokineospora sp. UTMC 2448]GGS23470.1 alanine racemase [Actinokineospora fastidiosa]